MILRPHEKYQIGCLVASLNTVPHNEYSDFEQGIRNSETSMEREGEENPRLDHMRALMASQNLWTPQINVGHPGIRPVGFDLSPYPGLLVARSSLGRSGDLVLTYRR